MVPGPVVHQRGAWMKREEEEEEATESERATQLAACGDRKQKQKLEKCDVNQNKLIVVCLRRCACFWCQNCQTPYSFSSFCSLVPLLSQLETLSTYVDMFSCQFAQFGLNSFHKLNLCAIELPLSEHRLMWQLFSHPTTNLTTKQGISVCLLFTHLENCSSNPLHI